VTDRRSQERPTTPRARARPKRAVFWTERALADLEAIGDYIARDKEAVAERWVARLVVAAEKAAMAPRAGRRVPELARDDVREVLLHTYRIVYLIVGHRLEILTVFEGHRLLPGDLDPHGDGG
jgi:toxin ParE1/3/4